MDEASINSWHNTEFISLLFLSIRDYEIAINLIFAEPALSGMPFHMPDGIRLYVPKTAEAVFKDKNLKYKNEGCVLKAPNKQSQPNEQKERNG